MDSFEGTFDYKSIGSLKEGYLLPVGWFAISHRWFEGRDEKDLARRRRRLAHGKWYKISSANGSIYRILRFSPQVSYSSEENRGGIILDWMGWLELDGHSETTAESLRLSLHPVKKWEKYKCAIYHLDPAYRLASWLAVISVGFGVLSVILAIVPWVLSR